MTSAEHILIPIGPNSPSWLTQRLVSKVIDAGLTRFVEPPESGTSWAHVEIKPSEFRPYTRFTYDVNFNVFLEALKNLGEPIVIKDQQAYYKIAAKEATLEYIRNPK